MVQGGQLLRINKKVCKNISVRERKYELMTEGLGNENQKCSLITLYNSVRISEVGGGGASRNYREYRHEIE